METDNVSDDIDDESEVGGEEGELEEDMGPQDNSNSDSSDNEHEEDVTGDAEGIARNLRSANLNLQWSSQMNADDVLVDLSQ